MEQPEPTVVKEVRNADGHWIRVRQCEWCYRYHDDELNGGRRVIVRPPGPSQDRRDEQGKQYDRIPLCQFCRAVLARTGRVQHNLGGGLTVLRDHLR